MTTVAVLLTLLRGAAHGDAEIRVLGLPVRAERVRQAAGVMVAAILLLAAALFLLALTEEQPFDRLLFEALSALGTVGLSLGATGELIPSARSSDLRPAQRAERPNGRRGNCREAKGRGCGPPGA